MKRGSAIRITRMTATTIAAIFRPRLFEFTILLLITAYFPVRPIRHAGRNLQNLEAFHSKVSKSIELLRRDRSSLTGVPGAHGTRQVRLTHYYSLREPAGTVRTGSIETARLVL